MKVRPGGSKDWTNNWYSQNEPVKYDDETRINAPKWKYAEEFKVRSIITC